MGGGGGGDGDSIRFLVFTIGYSNRYFPKDEMVCSPSVQDLACIGISRISPLVLPLHYELLDAFIPLNMPIVNELCCCCCCICCCCCCCWLFAWRPCFGTGGCRYSCLANVSTSMRSSFLYARQLLMKLCNKSHGDVVRWFSSTRLVCVCVCFSSLNKM